MSLLDVIKSLEQSLTFRKEATISGISFELALLNYEQDQMIQSFPDENDDPLTFYDKTRAQLLSYSIVKISGETIPDVVEVDVGGKKITQEKSIYIRDLLKKLPPKMIEKLFEIYIDFKDEVDTKINDGVEYTWYKTPEERKVERDKKEEEEELARKKKQEEGKPEVAEPSPDLVDKPITFTKIIEKDDDDVSQVV
jgi:hypothetical protein